MHGDEWRERFCWLVVMDAGEPVFGVDVEACEDRPIEVLTRSIAGELE
jgi:hypothetical protein